MDSYLALAAHTEGNQRLLDRVGVIETCPDGAAAMQSYQRLHRETPSRAFYFVHTGREDLEAMQGTLKYNLPFLSVTVAYRRAEIEIPEVLATVDARREPCTRRWCAAP